MSVVVQPLLMNAVYVMVMVLLMVNVIAMEIFLMNVEYVMGVALKNVGMVQKYVI